MALYFHIFISVALALTAVVQETRGYTTSYPTNGSEYVRLYNPHDKEDHQGLILTQLKVTGTWGPLCGGDIGYYEAEVICKQLGYSGYKEYYTEAEEKFEIYEVYSQTFYIGLACSSYDTSTRISDCGYRLLEGTNDDCIGDYGYAGIACQEKIDNISVSFNIVGYIVLVAIFFIIGTVIQRYRQRGELCNKRDQMTHTPVHTTNNTQGVVIPPSSGGSYPPPPPGTYPSQPKANYQYQSPSANTPLAPQYNTGLPPKEGAPPYQAQKTGDPYPQGASYPQGGAPYPPQGAGAPYPPQGDAPYPPQPAVGAPYPSQGGAPYPSQPTNGAPYPPQNAGAPYQSQYQVSTQGGAPTSGASAPAFNPAFPPAVNIPDANNTTPATPPPSYESAMEQ